MTEPLLFKMERSAAPLFGVRQYGVHINGFVRHSGLGLCLWLQRRSQHKQVTAPAYFTLNGIRLFVDIIMVLFLASSDTMGFLQLYFGNWTLEARPGKLLLLGQCNI